MRHSNSIDDLCLHFKVLNDKNSTTARHVNEQHIYYKCKVCFDPRNYVLNCKDYRSELYYKQRTRGNDKK